MKKRIFIAFLSVLLAASSFSFAQELHCNRAAKKEDKADKKESKIQKKMFRDRPYKAARKLAKSEKKESKVDDKEFIHANYPNHDGPPAGK